MKRDERLAACDLNRERIYPFLLRALNPEDRVELVDHLGSCEGCRLALEAIRARLEGVVAVPSAEAVKVRLPSASKWRRLLRLSAYALPAVLAFSLLLKQGLAVAGYRMEQQFLTRLQRAVLLYREDFGEFPPARGPLSMYLASAAKSGPYIKLESDRIDAAGHFLDRWGNRWQYRNPGQLNKGLFDLQSLGPNQRDDGGRRDDVANW